MNDKTTLLFVNYDTKSLRISQQTLQQSGLKEFSYTMDMEHYLDRPNKIPSLIFMDCNDPNMTGIGMIKRIKVLSPKTKVIALLSRKNLNLLSHALKNGAFEYILKGITEDQQVQQIITKLQQAETVPTRKKKSAPFILRKLKRVNLFTHRKFTFNNL